MRIRIGAILASALALAACGAPPEGSLRVAVVDAETSAPTPARVELLDAEGQPHVPARALRLTLQCVTEPPPAWAEGWVEAWSIDNPHTGTPQFYVDEPFEIDLPPGRYTLRAFKGIERRVARAEVEIAPGAEQERTLRLERWVDLPAEGWYGADDHLHITRLHREDDVRISRWLQGEDLHVANLLQMGTQVQFAVAPQRAFGEEGSYREGDHLLLAGQEHPRTHFLGHTITLGAERPVDLRDEYIVYERSFAAGREAGGAVGFAHFGRGPARDGLATLAPRDMVDFVEVLQFAWPYYDVWYELLNLGIPVTPTAGTDFPCGPWSMPGRERFYTRVEGRLARETWLEGIRRGRTFVTNGPLLSLRVEDAQIGDTLELPAPGRVRVEGRVRFDPERAGDHAVRLIRNGEDVPAEVTETAPGDLRVRAEVAIDAPAWLALRVLGDKKGEAPPRGVGVPPWLIGIGRRIADGADILDRDPWVTAREHNASAAHTAPIWVRVGGDLPGDAALAGEWTRRLDRLEARLADDRIGDQTLWDFVPYSDGVSEEHLRRNRPALLAAIAAARQSLAGRADGEPAR